MADDRNSYKGETITLELHASDVSGSITSVNKVLIMQDKEICYSTTAITEISPGVWSITVQTQDILYSGIYNDKWILDGGINWIEKTLTVIEPQTNIPSVSSVNFDYYSKDLSWVVGSDGDLGRIYNEPSIVAKIKAVVMTPRGALYNEPSYGTFIWNYLFSMSPNVADQISTELQIQLQVQVPQVNIHNISVTQVNYNSYNVSINFYNKASTSPSELLNLTNLVSVEQVL